MIEPDQHLLRVTKLAAVFVHLLDARRRQAFQEMAQADTVLRRSGVIVTFEE